MFLDRKRHTRPRALHCRAKNCKLRMDLAARTRASVETRAIIDHRGISWFGVNHKIADVSCPAHGNQRFVGERVASYGLRPEGV